jgi:undecaprenyl-diphosphatase
MSLPVVAGAGLVKAADLAVPAGWWPPFVWGTLAAAVSGWLAVHWMLLFVARVGLGGFAAYRVVAGIGVLALLASSYR